MRSFDHMQAYQIAFKKMDVPAYLLDSDGQLFACNIQLLRFLGLDVPNDHSIYNMLAQHGLWTRQQMQSFQQEDMSILISGNKNTTLQTVIHEKGDILYFEIVRTPLFDESGQAFGLMVTLRDITKQKQLETKVKDLEARLRYVNKFIGTSEINITGDMSSARVVKVLIVEDNLLTQKVEKKLLMASHCLTDAVATVEQMKEIFKPGKYDLVLVDLGLGSGNGNGYQATGIIREMEKGGQFRVPIIALTGADLNAVELECDDSEMDGIMSKPLTSEQAQQLVRRYVLQAEVKVTGLKAFKH